jgi:hypothetical protein
MAAMFFDVAAIYKSSRRQQYYSQVLEISYLGAIHLSNIIKKDHLDCLELNKILSHKFSSIKKLNSVTN